MSEINVFFCIEEREEFVQFCFANGFGLVPDQHYEENSYLIIRNIQQYKTYMANCVGFFLVHESYDEYPLEMNCFENAGKRVYYIMQRYGGPSIDFSTPILAEIESHRIGPGRLSIYSFYYHYSDKFSGKKELKDAFKLLSSYIHKIAQKTKVNSRLYWVGKHTIIKVKRKELKFVDMDNFDWSTILE